MNSLVLDTSLMLDIMLTSRPRHLQAKELRDFIRNRGIKVRVSIRQIGKGIGQAARLTFRQGDAGAMPRTATYLVNGRGVGNPRQRTLRWR
jgi:hypothetical protein